MCIFSLFTYLALFGRHLKNESLTFGVVNVPSMFYAFRYGLFSPRGMSAPRAIRSAFLLVIPSRQIISGSTWQIFTKFRRIVLFNRRLLIWPCFSHRSRVVTIATNFRVKIGEIGWLTSVRHLGILKRIEYRNSHFKCFICSKLSIHCTKIWWDSVQ